MLNYGKREVGNHLQKAFLAKTEPIPL